jgi:hypothetical protein
MGRPNEIWWCEVKGTHIIYSHPVRLRTISECALRHKEKMCLSSGDKYGKPCDAVKGTIIWQEKK